MAFWEKKMWSVLGDFACLLQAKLNKITCNLGTEKE
jgi:hypothetical protein